MDIGQQIRANRRKRRNAAARIEDLDAELVELVKQAFDEGVGATEIADIAGVTRARVYQIRDGRR